MLVLSRLVGQRLRVGPDVTITVVRVDRNTVRIGIEAPRATVIRREELARPAAMPTPRPPAPDRPRPTASSIGRNPPAACPASVPRSARIEPGKRTGDTAEARIDLGLE